MTVTFPLPTELQGVGRVVGRFIVVTPDTVNDADAYPEARGATGTVTFTPSTKLSKTTDYHAFVGHPSKTFPVDAYGIMQDEELTGGVWLREDTYTVSYNLAGLNIASHTIDVNSAHTNESPLVLSVVGPSEPPVGTTLVMLEVPSGPVDGQVLSWSGTTGLVWSAGVPIAVPTASTTVKGISELATSEETVTGTDNTRVTTPAGVKAALDAKSVSDMSTYVVQADLPTWTSLAGKPAVVAAGTTQADARTAIGAGTSNLTIGTTSTTAKAGNYTPPDASTTVKGIVELATTVEATTGTDTTRAVTPAGVAAAIVSRGASTILSVADATARAQAVTDWPTLTGAAIGVANPVMVWRQDTNLMEVSEDGTGWYAIPAGLTSSEAVTYETGWETANGAATVHRDGGWAWVTGIVVRSSGSATKIGTVPAGYLPAAKLYFPGMSDNGGGVEGPIFWMVVEAGGNLSAKVMTGGASWTTSTWFVLPAIPWRIAG